MIEPADALQEAAKIVKERGKTHGDFRETFVVCAELWSAYLRMPISPVQVAALNQLQKMARDQCSPSTNQENHNDNVGFAAIGAALAAGND